MIFMGIWYFANIAWLTVMAEKYGKTSTGRQKYKCLDPGCRRQFVYGSTHLVDAETKRFVINFLAQGIAPTKIRKAVPGISLRWIYELGRRMKNDRRNG